MARQIKKLSVLKLKSLSKPGRYSDGDGLYFYISSSGNQSWVFRYRDRVTGKLRDRGLGPYRHVSLEGARALSRSAQEQLRLGIDPIDAPRAELAAKKIEHQQQVTFGQCFERYIAAVRHEWRNVKHAAQWRTTIETYAKSLLDVPVGAVTTTSVLAVLEPIWATKTETATRVRQRIEAVLDWATARNYRTGENPARWRSHLDKLLAKPSKVRSVMPRPAMPYADVPVFLAELRKIKSSAANLLELQILTAARPSEVAGATWSEFDMKSALWTIPSSRMKANRQHRVPLSTAALSVITRLECTSAYLFPGGGKNAHLTTASSLKTLKTIRPGLSAHGFRSSFRDWAADMTSAPREVAEQALAHILSDKTEMAYRRSDLFSKRAALMNEWADYCEGSMPTITVVKAPRGKND